MELPEELKYLLPYIQRGQELDSREPIVAYYAYYYAAKLAISRGPSNKVTNGYLSHLLDTLEQKKEALGKDNETINDDSLGYAHLETFGLKVFMSADNEDRSGHSSKKTAKTFLAASVFLELLKTFGDLDPEIEGKIKYSKWKAADIIKAIREGRVPTPGAPGEQHDVSAVPDARMTLDDTKTDDSALQSPIPAISDFPSPPSNYTAPLASSSPSKFANDNIPSPHGNSTPASPVLPHPTTNASSPSIHASVPPPPSQQQEPDVNLSSSSPTHTPPPPPEQHESDVVSPSTHHLSPTPPQQQQHESDVKSPSTHHLPPPTSQQQQQQSAPISQPSTRDTPAPGPVQIAAAQKNAKWAISALNYDDIKTARTQLLDALNDLGFNMQNDFGYGWEMK